MQENHKRPRRLRLAVLIGAVFFLTAVGSAAAVIPASAASAARPAAEGVIPIPPAGWHPKTIARIWQDPRATSRLETLSPAACTALNRQHPGAFPHCQVRDYFLDVRQQPLPSGTRFAAANGAEASRAEVAAVAASNPYYQFYAYATQCSPLDGCNTWSTQLEAHGVYNYLNVYQWGVFCNVAYEGPGVTDSCGWRGFFDNGGVWYPSQDEVGMQFGNNGSASETIGPVTGTWGYGQRFYVNVGGYVFGYYDWY
jgi:hypothetical protein